MRGDCLIQEPVPEVSNLRRGQCWKTRHMSILEEEMTPLEGLRGSSLDIEVVLDRCVGVWTPCSVSGFPLSSVTCM